MRNIFIFIQFLKVKLVINMMFLTLPPFVVPLRNPGSAILSFFLFFPCFFAIPIPEQVDVLQIQNIIELYESFRINNKYSPFRCAG